MVSQEHDTAAAPEAPSDEQSPRSSNSDSMWVRRLDLGGILLNVEEEWGAGIGGTLWEGAVLMGRWLSCRKTFSPELWCGTRCIELGAGATGIPGLVAAHLACFRQVLITDIDECMPRLAVNVAANLPPTSYISDADQGAPAAVTGGGSQHSSDQPDATAAACTADTAAEPSTAPVFWSQTSASLMAATANSSIADALVPPTDRASKARIELQQQQRHHQWDCRTAVTACELDWRNSVLHLQPPFEVVLVADVLYAEELVDPLLSTMHTLSTPTSLVAIAIYNRSERASAAFWELLPKYFKVVEKIPEQAFGSAPQPDDIGIFLLKDRIDF